MKTLIPTFLATLALMAAAAACASPPTAATPPTVVVNATASLPVVAAGLAAPAPTTIAYPLPPTATPTPSTQPGRLLFSFPWPNSEPNAAPPGIAVGRDGSIFLTDLMRPELYRYTPDGQPLGRWDIPPPSTAPPPGAGPRTLAVAGDGSIYVPVMDGMQRLASDGRSLGVWPASSGSAHALAVGPDSTVYTIDSARSQVSRFTADGAPLGAWNGPRSDQPFRAAQAVAVGPDGTVYVADWGASSIHQFAPDGRFLSAWVGPPDGQADIRTPVALTVAPDGSLFVLEGRRHRVSRFDPSSRLIEWWDGPADGDRPFSPYALAISEDRVYVVDVANQRVQVYAYNQRA